jgi:hypothetical protein
MGECPTAGGGMEKGGGIGPVLRKGSSKIDGSDDGFSSHMEPLPAVYFPTGIR